MRCQLRVVAALAVLAVTVSARAQLNPPLRAVGPVTPGGHPFPSFYMDSSGVALEPCLAAGCALIAQPGPDGTSFDPALPVVWKTNFPGEVFYQSVQAFLPVFGVPKGLAVAMNVEATFLPTVPGGTDFNSANPIAFTRIRFTQLANKQGQPPVNFLGTYTITYPYGSFTFTADATGSLFAGRRFFTLDVPPGLVGVYNAPVGPPQGGAVPATNIIGTYLPSVTAPPGFIGDGLTPTAIVGSPTGNDFFRIERISGGVPGDPGDLGPHCPTLPSSASCIEIASFTVIGKKASGGPATHLVVSGLAAGTAGTAQTAVVKAVDAYGLPDFNFAGTVALTSNDPNAVLSPSATTLVNGVASVTVTPKAVGSFTLTAADQTVGTTVLPGSQIVAIAPRLQIVSGDLQSGAAGTALALPLVVRALDGNTPPAGISGVPVTFAASAGASVTPASAATGPTSLAQTTATLGQTPGTYTFTASVAGTAPVTFTASALPGAPASLNVALAGATTAGQPVTVTVAAFDAFGNPATNYSGALTVTSSDRGFVPPQTPTLVLGTATLAATFHTAGSQTLTVALAAAPAVHASQATLVGAAPASSVSAVPGGGGQSAPAGALLPLPLAVRVLDPFGNAVAGTLVTFAAPPGGSVAPASIATGADGTASTFATLPATAATYTFTAAAAGLAPVSFIETAVPGAVSRVHVIGLGATVTAGAPVSLTVQAFDSQNNLVAGNVAVVFTSSDPTATLPANAVLTGGQGQFPVTFKTAAAAQTLTVTAPGSTPITASVATTVLPAAAARLQVVSAPGSIVVGSPASSPFVVQVADAFGNGIRDVTVSFAAAAGGSINPATALTDVAGRAQATPSAPSVAGAYVFTATVPGLATPQVSISVTAIAAAPHHFVMSPPPAAPLVDCGCYDVDVALVDPFGNHVAIPLPGVTAAATGSALLTSVELAPGGAPAASIQGALGPGGTAVLHVCDARPESSTVQVSAATLPGASQVASWRLGPTDPQASIVSADTATLVAWSGRAIITVDPRSACGNRTGAGQAVVPRLVGPGTLGAVTDRGDGTYTVPLTVSPCPAATTTQVAVRVGAVDLPPLTEALACVAPAPDRTAISFSRTVVPMCDAAAKDQVTLTVVPRDGAGTPLGAGNSVSLVLDGLVGDGALVDVGDGSYTTTFTVASCSAASRTPTVRIDGVDLVRPDLALQFTCAGIDVAASGVAFSARAAPADGVASIEVTVAAMNVCGEPARGRACHLAADLGALKSSDGKTDSAGAWATTLSSSQPGTATVTATVDGVELPRASVTFDPLPAPHKKGGCATGGPGGAAALAGLVIAALAARRRGRRER